MQPYEALVLKLHLGCSEIVLYPLQEHPTEINLDYLGYITQPQFSHEEIDLLWNKAEII